jgi:hypothetical protein
MTRAFRDIIAARPSLADGVMNLYRSGAINKNFTVMDVAHELEEVFSDTEVREGLRRLARPADSKTKGRRLRPVAKYRYENVG